MKKILNLLLIILVTISCNDDDMNVIDYSEFDAVLTEARNTADISKEGEANGDIIIGSTEILNAVIEQYAPYRSTAINQGTVDIATKRIQEAIDIYNLSVVVVDGTTLTATIANAQALHDSATEGVFPGEYQEGAKATLQTAIDVAQVVADNTDAIQSEIDAALAALLSAINTFEDTQNPPLDFTALNDAITAAQELHDGAVEGSGIGDYAIGSKAILQSAIDDAIVISNTTNGISQEDVNNALIELQNAVATFENGRIGGPDRDITALNVAIANAQNIHDTAVTGTNLGEYPAEAKTALQMAIDEAQAIADDLTTVQSIVDEATTTLEAAVVTFQNSVNGIFVLALDGASHIETPTFNGIGGSATRTMEAWIKTEESTTNTTLILSWGVNESQAKWDMRLNSGRLRIEYAGGGINSTNTVNDGSWHHVAVVVPTNGANLDATELYIDGVLEAKSGGGATPINTSTANVFNIGRSASQTERHYKGQISDVRIWSVARTVSDINNSKDTRLNGNETGLVGYWKLNDGLGTTVADSSPSNHTGNFVGNPTWEKITTGLPFEN